MATDLEYFEAMQTGEPVARYKKTILAKVCVTILNPFSKTKQEIILEGEPGTKSSIVSVWSIEEDLFIRNMNNRHFEDGTLIPFVPDKKKVEDKSIEQSSDEEVKELVKKPFLTLQSVLNKTKSEAFVNRLLQAAIETERSDKIVSAIQTRLAEIQFGTLTQPSE